MEENQTEQLPEEELQQQEVPEQEQSGDLESIILGSSEEDLEKYDNFEEFLAEQTNSIEPEQIGSEETQETTQESNTEESVPTAEEVSEMSDSEFRQFITSTFRANHKDVQVTDPNDIRKLMQYGMNFHKKMGELAPHRKILKALEANGLTSESQVNFAIDLIKGKPDAIAQLLKQYDVDTYNLPDLEEQPYQQSDYVPSDLKVNFDEALADVKQSPKGQEVVEYLKGLDDSSFHEVYTNPIMIQNLGLHAENGLLADALNILETERALGKVPQGIKDIDAYSTIAEHLIKNNPAKYGLGVKPEQRVIGNNLNQSNNTQPKQHNSAKYQASIPNNQQAQPQGQSFSGVQEFLNADAKDLEKYATWEDFLAANNLNFQ